ncbi:MAG: GGDEF domain-containing protein [Candidatus Competibacteraceae bacterium]
MPPESQWRELIAQQLVRYEALFELLDEIQVLENIALISVRVAMRWKYFANVTSWRLVVPKDSSFQVIDGFRGEAHVADAPELSPWDAHHYTLQRPRLVRMADPLEGPAPPAHLSGKAIFEIETLPFMRGNRCIALLSVAARHEPFSDLDHRFIRIFGSYFADRVSDILLRRQATEILVSKATRDALTGLLNRGAIIERLGSQLALARRGEQSLSVILADIDFFKVINDSHGHLVGDAVLREVSRRLQAQTRGGDNLGRYGGEEFLLYSFPVARKKPQKQPSASAALLRTLNFNQGRRTKDLHVTISLGTSSTGGQEEVAWRLCSNRPNDALYYSKANGRNRVTVGAGPRLNMTRDGGAEPDAASRRRSLSPAARTSVMGVARNGSADQERFAQNTAYDPPFQICRRPVPTATSRLDRLNSSCNHCF